MTTPSLTDHQQAILRLCIVLNTSASAYWKLIKRFGNANQALQASSSDWQGCGIHANHAKKRSALQQGDSTLLRKIEQCQTALANGFYSVLFHEDIHYPKQLDVLYDRPPLLFFRGDKHALNQAQIAIVGTRKPSQAARDICENFALHFANEGLWVTSGLATGIDRHAHIGALKQQQGRTIAVLGNGITTCYPRNNQSLYDDTIAQGGVIVSEFLPDAKPAAHHFPRRNRIVSGLSLATVVVEAARKSGSMITANFAAEQGKNVFAIPGHIYNVQAQGCHQLIRNGAILVDDPAQVVEDINLPRRLHTDAQDTQIAPSAAPKIVTVSQEIKASPDIPQANNTPQPYDLFAAVEPAPEQPQSLPVHLDTLLSQLDWIGQDMDKLINITKLPIADLSSQLMELELLGLAVQQGGVYLRCRP